MQRNLEIFPKKKKERLIVVSFQNSVTLCAYPFILNAQAKTTMLQTDAELQMQVTDPVKLFVFVSFLRVFYSKENEKNPLHSVHFKVKVIQPDDLTGSFCCFLILKMAVSGANLHNVFMLLTLEPLLAQNPFLVLHVRRDHLVSDALRELTIYNDVDLKKPLKVSGHKDVRITDC